MTRSHGTKLNIKVSKLHIGTSKAMHLPLFWKSYCATCSPVYVILYHVTGSCKGSIAFTKSNAILYNYIHITQLPSTRHVYAVADLLLFLWNRARFRQVGLGSKTTPGSTNQHQIGPNPLVCSNHCRARSL